MWAHVTKLRDASVRFNICSSAIENKVGNTSNIIKHLLTKQHLPQESAALTLSTGSNSQETFISNVDSAIELHSRDTALIHNHKSTLFACASVYSLAVVSFMRFSDIRLCRALLPEECVLGPLKNGQTAHDYLVKLVNV